jgi:tetraacyldisaccharide 4'-kinase
VIDDQSLQRLWYEGRPRWLLYLLVPLSLLFAIVVGVRRALYRYGLLRAKRLSRPLLVIGNITVGGTGKTPFVIWLTEYLQGRGLRVGVVLRGYGGSSSHWPREVRADTRVIEVGDEAVLHASRTRAIVVAGPDRVAAAAHAIELGADLVLSDDGLQHYRLARDCEIAVIDEQRGVGNGWLLPAGPLREPASRLDSVDLIVRTQRSATAASGSDHRHIAVRTQLGDAVSLLSGERRALESFQNGRVHAVAGIGNPQAFFSALRAAGIEADTRAFADHAVLDAGDLAFDDDLPVLMTEKDAVKCLGFANAQHWYVRMDIEMSETDVAALSRLIDRVLRARAEKR